jgi:carboxyl-terminal processing protease
VSKTAKIVLGLLSAIILVSGAFAGGFIVGHLMPSSLQVPFSENVTDPPYAPTASPEQQTATPAELQTLFAPFWETWNLIHEQYVGQPVDDVKLIEGAITGMLKTLDTGLNYYDNPESFERHNEQLNGGEYEGIGAHVDVQGEYLSIITPFRGSPAEKAGLRPGDLIIAIDGADMTGVLPEDALLKVLGPADTNVTLTVSRKGEPHPFDVTITRAKIVEPLVTYEMRDDGIAYVALNSFGDTADNDLRNALQELLAQNPKGLIFDLRYNGGGYLDQGIAVASEFLPAEKIITYQKYGDGTMEEHMSSGVGVAVDIPMVLLVNEGSASASEIVAGALQDYGRAKLVGVTTYGKGSVQNINLLSNGGMAAITSAQWLTPNKRLIQDVGLTPDIYVQLTEADYESNLDPQLDTAVETLLAIVNNTPIPTSQPTPTTVPVP